MSKKLKVVYVKVSITANKNDESYNDFHRDLYQPLEWSFDPVNVIDKDEDNMDIIFEEYSNNTDKNEIIAKITRHMRYVKDRSNVIKNIGEIKISTIEYVNE